MSIPTPGQTLGHYRIVKKLGAGGMGEVYEATDTFARPDGRSIIYSVIFGPREHLEFWMLSLENGALTQLTRLEGRRGNVNENFTTDGRYLYFTWREDDGDIWVTDMTAPDRN